MTSPEPACEHLSQPAPGLRGGVPQTAIEAGSLAIHEAECSDDTCITNGHAGYQSDFNDDMARAVLEGAAPHIAADAYGQGRDDEAAGEPLRYTERTTP